VSTNATNIARFSLGQTCMTHGAQAALAEAGQSPHEFLRRHGNGDWGELSEGDRRANEQSLKEGSRILSAYSTSKGVRLWVITEADRSSTTILLPDEY
jgi:hypothetical protein